VRSVAAEAPDVTAALAARWNSVAAWAREPGLPLPADLAGSDRLADLARTFGERAAAALATSLTLAVLVGFFTTPALLEVPTWRDKLAASLSARHVAAAADSVAEIAHQVRRFLLIRLVLGAISGALAAGWLALNGVSFALVWGVLHAVLNLVPNIGSILAGTLAALFAFAELGLERFSFRLNRFGIHDVCKS